MKIRLGFVANSSSADYLLYSDVYGKEDPNPPWSRRGKYIKPPTPEEEIEEEEEEDFVRAMSLSPEQHRIENLIASLIEEFKDEV